MTELGLEFDGAFIEIFGEIVGVVVGDVGDDGLLLFFVYFLGGVHSDLGQFDGVSDSVSFWEGLIIVGRLV